MDGDDEAESIIDRFDSLCVSFGDLDAITRLPPVGRIHDEPLAISYIELQLFSQALASQLHFRFRPDFVLIDCFGHASAEATAILACLRLSVPFVPVSISQGRQGRLGNIAALLKSTGENIVVAAVTCVSNDKDPRLGVFYEAGIHRILFVDPVGNLEEQIHVPQSLPSTKAPNALQNSDALYVLFTSGTSGDTPKAVVGSQISTFRRLKWFRESFQACSRVARRPTLSCCLKGLRTRAQPRPLQYFLSSS